MHNGIGRRVNGQERQFGQQPERASRRAGGNKLFVHQEDPGRLCNHSQRPHPSPHLMLSVSSPFERISCNFERKGASVTGWLLSDASSPRGESTSSCRASFSSARVWFDDIVLSRVESTKKILYKTKWRPRIPAAETKSQWLVLGWCANVYAMYCPSLALITADKSDMVHLLEVDPTENVSPAGGTFGNLTDGTTIPHEASEMAVRGDANDRGAAEVRECLPALRL